MPLKLTFACGDYDRVRAIRDGIVRPNGIELEHLILPPGEIFTRAMRSAEFDVTEMSLGNHVATVARGGGAYVAIPVFPSRFFRHSAAYVSTRSGIVRPEDLRGKRVGIGEWQMTALVWMRGLLEDEYGVAPRDMIWVVGGIHEPVPLQRMTIELPAEIRVEHAPAGATLEGMLERAEIDALFTPRLPRAFSAGSDTVRRLFPDYRSAEIEYFRRTRIFPIMHTLAIRRTIYERRPSIAAELFTAFAQAKRRSLLALADTQTLATTLPWQLAEVDATRAVMGDDWWPYGMAANHDTLARFVTYAHRQYLTPRRLSPEELFVPESLALLDQ